MIEKIGFIAQSDGFEAGGAYAGINKLSELSVDSLCRTSNPIFSFNPGRR